MPNVYKPGLLQIRAVYDTDPDTGRFPENVLWFQSVTTTTPTLANLQAIQAVFDAHWPGVWSPQAISGKHYVGSVITDWSSNTGQQATSVNTLTPVAGTGTSSALPNQVAVLISLQILERYRGGHGRVYLPWVSTGAQKPGDANRVNPADITSIGSAAGTFIGQMSASGVLGGQQWSVYRHRNNSALAAVQPISLPVVSPLFASQRRRNRKVAHH